MTTMYSRRAGRIVPRQVGDTRWHDPEPHAQHWRAANEDYDPMAAPTGIVRGVLIGLAIWAAIVAVAWAT